MVSLGKLTEFDWDKGNIDKNLIKHDISLTEAEEVFLDENLIINQDFKHSAKESRSLAIGKTKENKILIIAYTVRKNKIRIISARIASKKERKPYEYQA